ncbi:hypothetical protein H9P43_009188 [Blastocladiella emersonii ATCC 22665]|nr:hypothetical protein H9P43_009188 [Blastocladiella emersonii ATCC 22665]
MDPTVHTYHLAASHWAAYTGLAAATVAGAAQIATAVSQLTVADAATLTGGSVAAAAAVLGGAVVVTTGTAAAASLGAVRVTWPTTAIVLGMLAVSNIVLAVIALSNVADIEGVMDDAWQTAYESHPTRIREVQTQDECCGLWFPTDRALPRAGPDACINSAEFGYRTPCYPALAASYRSMQTWLGSASILVAGVLSLNVLAVLVLAAAHSLDVLAYGYQPVPTDAVGGWPATSSPYTAAAGAAWDESDETVAPLEGVSPETWQAIGTVVPLPPDTEAGGSGSPTNGGGGGGGEERENRERGDDEGATEGTPTP